MTLVYFLMMLDMSILSTVRFAYTLETGISDYIRRLSHTSPTSSDRFLMWAGTELRTSYPRRFIQSMCVDCPDIFCSASFQPLTGKMYARFNSKKLFLGFFTIFNIGSAICGAAQTSPMLIAGRFIAGLGGAGLMNGGFTMIHASIPPERRPSMLGYFMACKYSVSCVVSQLLTNPVGNLGSASGPLIGGAITDYVSWRWCKYIPSHSPSHADSHQAST